MLAKYNYVIAYFVEGLEKKNRSYDKTGKRVAVTFQNLRFEDFSRNSKFLSLVSFLGLQLSYTIRKSVNFNIITF